MKKRQPTRRKAPKQAPTPPLDWLMPLEQPTPIQRAHQHFATARLSGSSSASAAILTVTSPEEIPAALAQGKPVLIDIPAFQWRASWLATIQKWSRSLAWWLVPFLAAWWLSHWLDAQLPNQDYIVPDWAKFNFLRQPDHKVILSPHEE
jgi:hypothetical protein